MMIAIAEKVKLFDMLKEGRNFAVVARHFDMIKSIVDCIRKDEANTSKTASISFNKSTMREITALIICRFDYIFLFLIVFYFADFQPSQGVLERNYHEKFSSYVQNKTSTGWASKKKWRLCASPYHIFLKSNRFPVKNW